MAKDPDDRYGTAGALRRAARRAVDGGQPTLATTAPTSPADPRRSKLKPVARRPKWLLPTVITAATTLLLGSIGVAIAVLAQHNSDTHANSAPIVTGPDQSKLHQSCDQGFTLPTLDRFGTHAGRGTPETSCFFTDSVLRAYWVQYGNASPLPRSVSAPGAVDCATVPGAECHGSDFLMHCQRYTGDGWITCTGGQSARVYLW